MKVSCDFETRSTVDLREAGVYVYAADPTTDLWCLAYAFDDEEPEIWRPGLPFPERLQAHIAAGGEMRAHNAAFERIIWREIGAERYGFPPVLDEQWVCTAAEAAAMSLPRSLDDCARVTGVAQQKDNEGYGLMQRMARPRAIRDDGTVVWWDVPDRVQKLEEYCKQDVRTERAIAEVLHRLIPRERELYLLNERINDRGVLIDKPLAEAMQSVAEEGASRASRAIYEITNGAVTGVTSTGQMREWLSMQGVETASVAKARVQELLTGPLPDTVRRVLETRAEAGRSSVAKIGTALRVIGDDCRARGLSLYHGAATGRFTGRLLQPHNFPRGEIERVEDFIPEILRRDYDTIDLMENPVAVVSGLLRALVTAAPGHDLIAGDFSAIEARVLNWLAGQEDMVAAFHRYDASATAEDRWANDPYVINAQRIYGLPLDAIKKFPHRHTGKFQELGCGYGMGAVKAQTAAADIYGIELTGAEAKAIVGNYRETHPLVVNFWYEGNAAALAAVTAPGSVHRFGASQNCKFVKQGAYLYLILPSKRYLVYAAPRIVERITPWGETRPAVEIDAIDSYTRKWGPAVLYGGLIIENVVQAVSRDLLAEAMFRLEAKGYSNVLNVHDEIVCEITEGFGSLPEFESIMRETPAWAEGCPVNAEAWRAKRYRK